MNGATRAVPAATPGLGKPTYQTQGADLGGQRRGGADLTADGTHDNCVCNSADRHTGAATAQSAATEAQRAHTTYATPVSPEKRWHKHQVAIAASSNAQARHARAAARTAHRRARSTGAHVPQDRRRDTAQLRNALILGSAAAMVTSCDGGFQTTDQTCSRGVEAVAWCTQREASRRQASEKSWAAVTSPSEFSYNSHQTFS